jgi:hypothetical protein
LDATKPIYQQVQDLRSLWREVWWGMGNGNITEYNRIKAMDVMEYYKLFDLWRARVDKERELYQQRKNHHNGK